MRAASALDGIVIVDKPAGWTSHDVVAKARGITRQRRIGHTGTLDPLATGVLVLCLGQATRLVEYMTAHDKRYVGEIVLGVTTDTDDAEGEVVSRAPIPDVGRLTLDDLERQFSGPLLQRPPNYSAIKVGGKRAYSLARAGEAQELAARPVVVHELRLRLVSPGRLTVEAHCGPGTYIRSLARDIGEAIGCGAHLSALRRTSVGGFALSDAVRLEQLERHVASGTLDDILRQPDEGVLEMDVAIVEQARATALGFGAILAPTAQESRPASAARIYDSAGRFVGIGSVGETGEIRGSKVLNLAKPLADQ